MGKAYSIPSTSSAAQNHLTPELICSFPKAQVRKSGKRGGRRPGRCRILTDTPEKREIEQQAAVREITIKRKQVAVKRKVMEVSSSSSEDEELVR
ncbi:hypothetical protein QE152_g10257 [Popillia japonica]|uniref:Uncharacterized protein n=1 Tax=Popillia japonica TaxID=7064 RepID=A0AAW1LVT4_POPJA